MEPILDVPFVKYSFLPVMELLSGGPVEWSDVEHQPILMLRQARRILRDTVLGLEYRMLPSSFIGKGAKLIYNQFIMKVSFIAI